jgi:hypothetical protein
VIGVSVTGDWFNAGFELGLDGSRWQARTQSMAFIQLWGDAESVVWDTPLASPCTSGSTAPERVLLTGVNWEYTTQQEWQVAFGAAVTAIQVKYPDIVRIELMTIVRAPGNVECEADGYMQVVDPSVDAAIAALVAASGGLVVAAPAFYAPTCDVFIGASPHFEPGGAEAVAGILSAHYQDH